jgi:hypothetical protein
VVVILAAAGAQPPLALHLEQQEPRMGLVTKLNRSGTATPMFSAR